MTNVPSIPLGLSFDNSYGRLPERFYARQNPVPVAEPRLIRLNRGLAGAIGLDPAVSDDQLAGVFAGNRLPEGADPLAQAYAGHQFGGFSPQLGDGRALLLGEVIARDGRRLDLQLKGAGQTPFSRRGDGRAALGPVLREYLVSEAMAALGIPTTRALAAVTTGLPVLRETVLPGAILTRIAASHIRVGTFQYFAARGDRDALELLVAHVVARHYPEAGAAENPALALLAAVMARQAALVARWLQVGFIHGVMNTDNCSIAGETIDYGPCAFMDAYDPATVYSSIDQQGRYAYANQPVMAHWNLARFAETLLDLIDADQTRAIDKASEVLAGFAPLFRRHWLDGMAHKIGLAETAEADAPLIQDLLETMKTGEADYTNGFRALGRAAAAPAGREDVRGLFVGMAGIDAWLDRWLARLAVQGRDPAATAAAMDAVNPAYIPRNHRVQQAIDAAMAGDFGPFEALHLILARPFEDRPEAAAYAAPPEADERVLRTFCGT
ncbi:YdiU family protein [Zavarzinia compransoris]|uniref:Protein nucleotidyltransferase YdiU n=2 Tax=Zavarzinia compransoris TaxID=1264899 RepID=A0A317E3W3_9PROT|nr:YdiU family protein [Zavarzinia compransoris]PWR21074.1 YdiU family protein [Zavarzinia compransoris]